MFRAWLPVRAPVLALALALCAPSAQAFDPLTLFLLRMLRDQAISSSIESGVSASQQRPDQDGAGMTTPYFVPLQPTSESQQLKMTIDDSFLHLGPQQRAELHASLMRILNDPKNSASRDAILSEFKGEALALRNSHRMLSQLSESDMRVVAVSARTEFEKLPPEQRQQLLQALQHGVPGMPQALHDMMLAEFSSVPAAR
jgi:hypothetical protein